MSSSQIANEKGPLLRTYAIWTRQELLILLREPIAVFFSLLFPVILYIFIGIPYADKEVQPGIKFIDMMFPALIISVIANLLLMGLPTYLAELRSRGTDRRYSIIPLPKWIFALALLSATLVLVILSSGIMVAVVGLRDGILPTAHSPAFLALVLGSIIWLAAVGFFIGSLPVSPRTVQAISAVVFFTMFFGSGAAVPIEGLPQILQDILEWNPLKQWLDVMVGYYTQTEITSSQLWHLLIIVPVSIACAAYGSHSWKRR
jgi:ABC-2 type transport system permease protein